MSEQEIRVGQRWRRKSDGVVVEVTRVVEVVRGVANLKQTDVCWCYPGERGWNRTKRACWGTEFRGRYDLIEADQ